MTTAYSAAVQQQNIANKKKKIELNWGRHFFWAAGAV
jgi:hypothetical protein